MLANGLLGTYDLVGSVVINMQSRFLAKAVAGMTIRIHRLSEAHYGYTQGQKECKNVCLCAGNEFVEERLPFLEAVNKHKRVI